MERDEILRILGREDDAAEILPESVSQHLREPQSAEHNGSDQPESVEADR